MLVSKFLNASEARKNFYQLLKKVAQGEQIFIENTDTGEKFQIVKAEIVPKKDTLELMKQLGEVGLKSMPIKEMKEILTTMHNPLK